MRYSRDLTNVKVGDIRSIQFEVGIKHPLRKKYVPARITRVNASWDGKGIEAETIDPFIWPEDPQGKFWEDPSTGEIHWETVPEHEATHRGWVVTKGHIKDISFPITLWVARYKTGHLVAFTHKPVQRGMYWEDDYGHTITLPRNYYPEVKFSTGPKEVTYIQSI